MNGPRQLDPALEPDAAVPVNSDVASPSDALRAERVPDETAALRHDAREFSLTDLPPDNRKRDAGHVVAFDRVGSHHLVRKVANACHAAVPETARRSGTEKKIKAPPHMYAG